METKLILLYDKQGARENFPTLIYEWTYTIHKSALGKHIEGNCDSIFIRTLQEKM